MRIVVGVDGSDPSFRAVRLAAAIAAGQTGSDLVLLHAVQTPTPHSDALDSYVRAEKLHGGADEAARAFADAALSTAAGAAASAGALCVACEMDDGDAATALLGCAVRHRADLIAAGRRGLGWMRAALLGSVSQTIAREAQCAVLIVP
jgi:nucleotide-binding universal stress UspA family protein